MFNKKLFILAFTLVCIVSTFALASDNESVCSKKAITKDQTNSEKGAPVDLQADKLVHNKDGQSVTASGKVVLKQEGKMIKADKIIYNLQEDTVIAVGNVVFVDKTGDKHFAEKFEFNDALKNGFVQGLKSYLVDGSRFTASSGRQTQGGDKVIMKDAHYTPCEIGIGSNDKGFRNSPLWQIRASKIIHDKSKKRVDYNNARFEVKGMPVVYLPYFSHPDGSVKRKSGFLMPKAGYKSNLGGFIEGRYYWSIAPEKDLTVGLMAMTQEAPMLSTQWRQRWSNASLDAKGSFTYSGRTDREGSIEVGKPDELRGNLKVNGLWDINNKWRSGIKIDLTSDDQYLRQYNLNYSNVLQNELYVERFSGRNYAAARMLAFQDIRINNAQSNINYGDQPNVLPEVEARFIGEPNNIPFLSGRWSLYTSLLGLVRDNNGQDINRAHSALEWQRRFISNTGFTSNIEANIQGSIYKINDQVGYDVDNTIKRSEIKTRAFAYINAESSYPLAKTFKETQTQMIIEPLISLTLSPNIDTNKIPNEDSQDLQIDALALFEPNRFSGVDGVEDRSHISYGMRTGIYGTDGSYGNLFIGQSYRFENDDNPFDVGSGLSEQSSDIVGEVKANYKGGYQLDYRFQLDNDKLSPQRQELTASLKLSDLTLSSNYLYAKAIEGSIDIKTREQINNSASYYINDRWRLFGSARHDLGDNSGLRNANIGVDYTGQCISLSLTGQRNLTDNSSGNSGTEIFFRIGLKNLGEFKSSGFQLGSGNQ